MNYHDAVLAIVLLVVALVAFLAVVVWVQKRWPR